LARTSKTLNAQLATNAHEQARRFTSPRKGNPTLAD
jgi:hypothetical protein